MYSYVLFSTNHWPNVPILNSHAATARHWPDRITFFVPLLQIAIPLFLQHSDNAQKSPPVFPPAPTPDTDINQNLSSKRKGFIAVTACSVCYLLTEKQDCSQTGQGGQREADLH
ncbi:MAG: hypothetical protein CSB23_00555 [Deltaproteobacteria bacterium]|nr:MAG: hypothetical protein CSB23_00555 [Deltaproteobacteria bacterium]